MGDWQAADRAYTQPIYRRVLAYMSERRMTTATTKAGCARCQACSGLGSMEPLLQIGDVPA
jgi:hypothetical protein